MSKIEVNAIEPQCGTNLTVGASGDTITFPSGTTVVNNGSQTGFGRTGTVDWDTTAKTASFTAVSGNGYFVNTTSGAITLTLPASPSAGDIVSFKDYAFTFATNNLTVDGNGSPIGGVDGTQGPKYSTNGTSKTFIYVDGTKGWLVTNESTDTSQETTPTYIVATGGTVTTSGDYKIHTFTGPGTFTVCSVGNPAGSNSVDYLVVAGGGSGGRGACNSSAAGGGGGAGGFRESSGAASGCYTASPLGACVSALPVAVQGYPITVGAGGPAASLGPYEADDPAESGNGSNSIFSSITSTGGGGGANRSVPSGQTGASGGSGGGSRCGTAVGAGNTPPVSPPQGNSGSLSPPSSAGAGGGATAAGGTPTPTTGGNGGNGGTTSISASPTAYAGGGGAGGSSGVTNGGTGGTGGGGDGSDDDAANATAGTTNTGGGGGGGGGSSPGSVGKNGGSGIVIIRYKYQ